VTYSIFLRDIVPEGEASPLGAAAVLITLVYHAVTFWFALVVGGVTFRLLQRQPATQSVAIDKILCAAQRCEPKLL
jgi:hypothetical protein